MRRTDELETERPGRSDSGAAAVARIDLVSFCASLLVRVETPTAVRVETPTAVQVETPTAVQAETPTEAAGAYR